MYYLGTPKKLNGEYKPKLSKRFQKSFAEWIELSDEIGNAITEVGHSFQKAYALPTFPDQCAALKTARTQKDKLLRNLKSRNEQLLFWFVQKHIGTPKH